MEILFETKSMSAYREIFHQIKRVQVSMESVVPDTQDDIGRLLSVQPALFLKEKTATERGVYVCGEAIVSILYINELENGVSSLQLSQNFTLEYEQSENTSDLLSQISLAVTHSEAHILNPRKLSVTLEVMGELSAYLSGSIMTETVFPTTERFPVHTKQDCVRASLVNAVCEKSFVLNEQIPFSPGRPQPREILSQCLCFLVTGKQLIGSKILVKGRVNISVCYLSDESGCPFMEEFSVPFSQLVDIGQEAMDGCVIRIEPTASWFSLIDSLNGEKALDAEIHALIQIVSRREQAVSYLSDAYCNLYPMRLLTEPLSFDTENEPALQTLNLDEQIELPEDCMDVILIIPMLGNCSLSQGRATAILNLDLLYRTESGTLSCIHRSIGAENALETDGPRLLQAMLTDSYFRPDGRQLSARATVEMLIAENRCKDCIAVVGAELNEDDPCEFSALPALYAVRVEEESLWELARTYHSSPEKISALNDVDGVLQGRLLLIPKSE